MQQFQQQFTIPIGTSGSSDNLDLAKGLPLSPKLGVSRAGISTSGYSDDFFNSGITILFSRVKSSAYYEFIMGLLGPSVAFTFQEAQVTLSNPPSGGGQVDVQIPQQDMRAGMQIGMVFGGGVFVTEQLYLPSSWHSPWKFTWHSVFQGSIGFEIDFLALFFELITFLLDQGAEDELFSKDTANTLNSFVKGRETFNFLGYVNNNIGPGKYLSATAKMDFPMNLVDFEPALAGFVKLLEKVSGDLQFGPALNLLMPVNLNLDKFTVVGGQGSKSTADYGSLTYGDYSVTATGPKAFSASATKFTTQVSYSAGFSIGLSCYFYISACKIFSVSLYTPSLDLLTGLGIPVPTTPTVDGSVSTEIDTGCVLIPDLSLVFTSAQTDPDDKSLLLPGVPFLAEVILQGAWTGPDTTVQITIDPPVDGFPTSLPLPHGNSEAEFVFTFGNQCVYSGDPDHPGAKQSPSFTSPYQSFSITATIPPDPAQPCLDLETTIAVKLKNSVIAVKLLSGTAGDAPVWNEFGGAQLNADPSLSPQDVTNHAQFEYYFPYPSGAPPVSSAPVTVTLYDEQRNLHAGSNVRITFDSGASAVLSPSAQLSIAIPPTSATQTFRIEWLSPGPHYNFSNRFYVVIDAGCGFGQTEFWLSVWNAS
ncbi:MAG: hypothetical protein JOY85_04500 [Acidobacteriaceae bacterium]|nr:hypothetical protein [Acidobacteriaceae bacterium]